MRAVGPRLKDLGRWSSGGTPPRDRDELWEGDLPWISAKDFHNGELREPTAFITEDAGARYSRIAPAGSILLIVRGMALAHGLQVAETRGRVAFNQDLRALTVARHLVPRFVYYALRGNRFRLDAHIDRAAHGTARVTDSLVAERVHVFPSHLEQQRVANFLDSECERIDRLSCELEALGVVGRSLFRSELDRAVAKVPRTRLKHLGYQVTQGWSPEAADRPPREGEVGVLRLSAVSTGRFRPSQAKALDASAWREAEHYLLREGDLLLVRASGSLKLLGTVARVEGLGRARLIFPDLVYRLEDGGSAIPRRLLIALLSTSVGEAALTQAKRGAANNKLRLEDVRNLLVPAPRLEQVRSLTALADRRHRQLEAVDSQVCHLLSSLAEYRDALITEAVTGKLDVTRLSEQQMDESAQAAMEGEAPEVLSA